MLVLGMFHGDYPCLLKLSGLLLEESGVSRHVIPEFRSSTFHFSPEKAAEDPS